MCAGIGFDCASGLRLKRSLDARYLRLSARSLRRTRDHVARRTIIETVRAAEDMTDPYEYRDLGKLLYEQLPADLQRRGVTVAVMPGAFGEAPIAIFTGPNGRSLEFPVQEDGRITEAAVAQLCVVF
jgi:hypothetical protein